MNLKAIFKNLFAQGQSKEVQEAIQKGALLIDVRSPEEYSAGSIKGAINIPLNSIENELEQLKDKGTVIVFCQSGFRSSKAKRILEKGGVDQVYNGGGWKNLKNKIEES